MGACTCRSGLVGNSLVAKPDPDCSVHGVTAQPLPVHNSTVDVQQQVMDFIEDRRELGIRKYGAPLQANNGRDSLRDLFEELVDAVLYCAQTLIERDGVLP